MKDIERIRILSSLDHYKGTVETMEKIYKSLLLFIRGNSEVPIYLGASDETTDDIIRIYLNNIKYYPKGSKDIRRIVSDGITCYFSPYYSFNEYMAYLKDLRKSNIKQYYNKVFKSF